MFSLRLFVLSGLILITQQSMQAQAESPAPETRPSVAATSPAAPQITFSDVHVDGPYVAMTFDDGPNPTLTPKLLDLLAKHHMKATFFVVGQNAADHPEILRRAVHEGHEIANHSWSHPNLGKMGDDAVRRELQKTDDAITAAIGTRPTLMRPPYGSITARQKSWIHEQFGYRIILWDVDPLDWKRPGPSVVAHRIVSEAKPGSIILAHDIHAPTIEAMPDTFDQLEAKGFKFVTVTELLAMAKPLPPKPAAAAVRAPTPIPVTSPSTATAAAPATPNK